MWMAEQFVLLMATPLGGMRHGWNPVGVGVIKNFEIFGILLVTFLNKVI